MNQDYCSYTPQQVLWNRDFIVFLIVTFIVTTGFNMTMPVMSGAAASLGAAGTLMGFAASAFAIVALLTRPITSPMADLLNKKRQYQLAVILCVVCNIGYSIAGSVGILIAFRCVQGFALGILGTSGATLCSFYIPQDRISTGMGTFAIIQIASLAIGPYIGLWLVGGAGYGACFIVAAAISAVSLLLTTMISDVDGGQPKGRISEVFKKPKLNKFLCYECLVPAGTMCMFGLAFACINSFLAQVSAENGVANIGIFFTAYAVTTMLARPGIEMLGKRFRQESIIVPCGLLFLISLALLASAKSLLMYLGIAVLMGAGYGSVGVILLIICAQRVNARRRGIASGTYYLSMDFGFGIGPVIGGSIAAAFSYSSLMYFLIIPVVFAILISALGRKGMQPLNEAADIKENQPDGQA